MREGRRPAAAQARHQWTVGREKGRANTWAKENSTTIPSTRHKKDPLSSARPQQHFLSLSFAVHLQNSTRDDRQDDRRPFMSLLILYRHKMLLFKKKKKIKTRSVTAPIRRRQLSREKRKCHRRVTSIAIAFLNLDATDYFAAFILVEARGNSLVCLTFTCFTTDTPADCLWIDVLCVGIILLIWPSMRRSYPPRGEVTTFATVPYISRAKHRHHRCPISLFLRRVLFTMYMKRRTCCCCFDRSLAW